MMKTVTAGRPLIDFIQLCYRAGLPPLLVGSHGVGKSEILEQATRTLGIAYICRDLSLMEPPDLVGMPRLDGERTRYLPPAFLPEDGEGLLVFEELNRCPAYMRGPCLQLLTARTLNDYRLPKGWLPAAAINPLGDEAYDVQELDLALLSRFVRVHVVADPKEWLVWARGNGIHPDVLGYVAGDPTVFGDGDGPHLAGDAGSNPRSWKMVSDVLRAFDGATEGDQEGTILTTAIAGIVGPEREVAFRQFRKDGFKLPTAEDLIENYPHHRAQVQNLTKQGRTDRLNSLVHIVKVMLQSREKVTHMTRDNFAQFLGDLPADFAEDIQRFLRERGHPAPPNKRRRRP